MKPSIIKRGIEGELFLWYKKTKLDITDVWIIWPKRKWWEEFYEEHRGKSFFPKLIEFMISGISLAFIMEGEDAVRVIRTLNGATDPKDAAKGTIRATFTPHPQCELPDNGVHGSASVEDAKRELGLVYRHFTYPDV